MYEALQTIWLGLLLTWAALVTEVQARISLDTLVVSAGFALITGFIAYYGLKLIFPRKQETAEMGKTDTEHLDGQFNFEPTDVKLLEDHINDALDLVYFRSTTLDKADMNAITQEINFALGLDIPIWPEDEEEGEEIDGSAGIERSPEEEKVHSVETAPEKVKGGLSILDRIKSVTTEKVQEEHSEAIKAEADRLAAAEAATNNDDDASEFDLRGKRRRKAA